MRQLVFDINEMSDSKEVYSRRPNPAFAIFLYTITALLLIALLYAFFGKIEMVATSAGVIRPNEDVSTVSCFKGGVVTDVQYHNGQHVQYGDVLLSIDKTELQIQYDSLQKTKAEYVFEIEMQEKFLSGIDTSHNPFSADVHGEEYAYYIQFENYLLHLQSTQQNFDYDANRANSDLNAVNRQINKIQAQIAGLKSYKKSVEQGENLASDYPEYEKMYFLYTSGLDALRNEYEAQRKQIENTASEGQKDELLANLEATYATTKEQELYQTVVQIDNSIRSLQAELTAAKASLKQSQITKNVYQESLDENGQALPVSIAVAEQTAAVLNQRDSAKRNLEDLEMQIKQITEQMEQATVTAQRDGTISITQEIVAGDIVSAGQAIATIIPNGENIYKVQLYVSNADIANIEVGDSVKYNIAALPSNQYGNLTGKVISISADTMIQNGQYSGYYLVECTIEKDTLTDGAGNKVTITAGMQLEGKIVTQEKTIFQYLLEKINIL